MKRQRGRGRKSGGNQQNRSFESNGPDVKIRGNAPTVYEKYLQLARDASSSGDRVMAENYYQHAEHYFRIVQANQPRRDERQEGEESGQGDQRGGQGGQGGDQRGRGQDERSDNRQDNRQDGRQDGRQDDRGDRQDQGDGRRGRGRGRGGDDERRSGESRGEAPRREERTDRNEEIRTEGKAEPAPRRGRRKAEESVSASDPLAVVNPEGDGESQSGGSELTAQEASETPKRKPRAPRKPRSDKAAQDALDKVGDGEGKTGSGGDKDSEAA